MLADWDFRAMSMFTDGIHKSMYFLNPKDYHTDTHSISTSNVSHNLFANPFSRSSRQIILRLICTDLHKSSFEVKQ